MTNQMSQNLSWFSQPNVSNHLTTDRVRPWIGLREARQTMCRRDDKSQIFTYHSPACFADGDYGA